MINERNRDKLGLALDLQHPQGKDLFLRLVTISDVVSQNFSARVLPDLGLGYDILSAVNPRIILLSIMSQGATGPESAYVSYGPNLEQLSGISYVSGYPNEPTSSVGFALPDPLGGAVAALALLAALRQRDLTGRGMHIDLSQREAATLVVGHDLVSFGLTGERPPRGGNHEPGRVPSECYPCAGEDEWIAISVGGDGEWLALCRAMDQPDLAAHPRFATILGRLRHRDELDSLIGCWTAQHEKEALLALLQQWGVTAGAALNPRELFHDPQLQRRGFWERVEDYSAGIQEYYGMPAHLSLTPLRTRRASPKLGQHNREIFRTLLGLEDAEIARLEDEGVIGTAPVLSTEGGIGTRSEQ